jgi:hypothetical protein
MGQFDVRAEGAIPPDFSRMRRILDPHAYVNPEPTLQYCEAAQFVFCVPEGSVVALGGIDGAALRELFDQAGPNDRRALFLRLRSASSVHAYVEQAIAVLAKTVMRLWPVWFADVSFDGSEGGYCR